ncbi:uncharacterized protein LOC104883506 isoform X5 [Beta vulgaris subsp. vulgaris]|uniref:uncharacterized protein LOC104883506 isoform X5 n=1 Tax=Beta vulgaris subsp. vulgaris TaxID=3555 RepID=UPI0020369D18|nr:uncharacterized protein LOC104883506 isoform X5 [Beta vulgaris subsp. vulgaris]
MADPHNVEFEAAKFLQKLIHESTDEPAKLATKLYVILQHMKASGKENSMPYQVISRAMETVINQHGLDVEALMSSRLPSSSGSHVGESNRAQQAGCSQSVRVVIDSKSGMAENDTTRPDGFSSGRPPVVSTSIGNDPFQGSVSQRSAMSFDHESPSSMDTRSTNSFPQDRREPGWEQQPIQKDHKRASIKRKRADSSGITIPDDTTHQPDTHSGMPDLRKERLTGKSEAGGTLPVENEFWKHGYAKGSTNFRERAVPGTLPSGIQVDITTRHLNLASSLDAAGNFHTPANADRLSQVGNSSNLCEGGLPGSSVFRDSGKYQTVSASSTSMPFKEHHLKQLRAQCLVFLAFRNGLSPKRLHLEIALGNILSKEVGSNSSVDGTQNELIKDQGRQQCSFESSSMSEVALPVGNRADVKSDVSAPADVREADLLTKEAENIKPVVVKPCSLANLSHIDEEKKHLPPDNEILEDDRESQETANSSALVADSLHPDTSGMRSPATHINEEILHPDTCVIGVNKQLKPDMIRWTRVNHNDPSRGPLHASVQHELGSCNGNVSNLSQRDSNIQNQQRADSQLSASWKSIQGMDKEYNRARPANDANMLLRNALLDGNGGLEIQTRSISDGFKVVPDSNYMHKDYNALAPTDKVSEPEAEEKSVSANMPPSPKCTLSEKWIMAHQKKKLAVEQKWVQKLQKADNKIATCFNELKETVSSSGDISAKTRSVIELKKLQLLELQRCLRRNILSDFFKPIQTDMDRLKSIKKHRVGRRLKHVEKFEQKMKEERQKRIRERQKEFFSEVEVHKEKLEDVFKYKRERCKGFNRYVKEFHKRKERIHREKIDRIQREKINLLKINDVEGYLRMVQDAKSDRVKQLLKETEKYLQKLGSKLKEAKAAARQFEMEENRIATIDESSDIFTETEDESDQAKHYKESNEKYYLIAHSIKENIAEQPAGLRGGKLREYQMNGLRWLVSLYNNHLNGILADEMGLGKTVQVISLICYLMETKNDRGPFLVVVPSSVLPGWEQEMSFWAPGINKIVYAGPPEERRRLFKESIIHQKFNVLLTTYEYLMNKHDRPKLSKIFWHYVIIDEGHRIKNASCKLNADLKLYHSSHRLLLTGTPLQNNLEELWALLNFLLPNIFNSSEDFSQWFNKPFESNGDNSPDEALLSEEENLLIINRLHQVLRPFVLRRLKHKVENELPEKIERLVRCEASAYQKLLMKRVEENLGSLGMTKARTVHNSVMELRNICNHPYLSQLHAEEVDNFIPKHFLPPIIRLCGKLEMLDRLLPKLKATNHRVLFFSTMTRLLDVMEEYLVWKQYRYLRLDGHTSGMERGALIEQFNRADSPFFIFLLSIRAGGVGVNLQAADTVIIFDTDWNPQVDLQAQARAHRIGQKKDVLVLRLETVHTVEEQVRAAAEHKLGVANQSITAGFFDNNTSAEDRREYLESLLRESKKEEAAPVLDDDSLNDILARSESEIDVFESIDQKRREEEMVNWKRLVLEKEGDCDVAIPPLPSRLVTDDDLKTFYEAMKIHDVPNDGAVSSSGMKRKSGYLGGFDTQQYGRGKRAREVRSYEEQWTEEEFEKICQAESPETPKPKDEKLDNSLASDSGQAAGRVELSLETLQAPPPSLVSSPLVKKEVTPPVKRGRGRPRRTPADVSPAIGASSTPVGVTKPGTQLQEGIDSCAVNSSGPETHGTSIVTKDSSGGNHQADVVVSHSSKAIPPLLPSFDPRVQYNPDNISVTTQPKRQGRKGQPTEKYIEGNSGTESVRRRGRKPGRSLPLDPAGSLVQESKPREQPLKQPSSVMSASTTSRVSPNNLLAEGVGGSGTKCVEGRTGLAVQDSKVCGSEVKQTSLDLSSETVAPFSGTETNKPSAFSNNQIATVQDSLGVSADTAAKDPKRNDQSKVAVLDSSSVPLVLSEASLVTKGYPVSQDQLVSISESFDDSFAAAKVGILPSLKSGTGPHEVNPPAAYPCSGSALTGSLRPGRRQSQKPQCGIEPVRRRGRKRGGIVSTHPAPPDVHNKKVNEPVKSTDPMSTSVVKYDAAPFKSANPGLGSHVVTVPVIPLVPVSGFARGSTQSSVVSSSVHPVSMDFVSTPSIPVTSQPSSVLSGAPAISSEQVHGKDQRVQAGEIVPRRRGRKKSASLTAVGVDGQSSSSKQSDRSLEDHIDRKVISTRSRQINISQTKILQEEAHASNTSIVLTSKDLEAIQSPNLSSHVVSPSVLDPASVKANGASKTQESRFADPIEYTTMCRSLAEVPPVSCKGKTNVIVLALESTGSAIDPTEFSCRKADKKEDCLELSKDAAKHVPASEARVSRLEVNCAGGTQDRVDEELSAPPGFDTPRPEASDTAMRNSLESNDDGMLKNLYAKRGPVVLALESLALAVDPCSTACINMSEKEVSSELHRAKDAGSGSVSLLKPIEPAFKSPSTVLTSQPEEEISAPPGFDIPQRCSSENATAMSLECDDGLASDMLADSSFKSNVEEVFQGPHDGTAENGTVAASRTAIAVGSDIAYASTLYLRSREDEHFRGRDDGKVDDTDAPTTSRILGSSTAAASSSELNVEKCREHDDGYAENAACDSMSDAAATFTLAPKKQDDLHGCVDDNGELQTGDAPAESCVVRSVAATSITSILKEKEECHGVDDNVEHDVSDALPASYVVGSLTETSTTLILSEKEGCHAFDDQKAEHEAADTARTLTLESKEKFYGSEDGYTEIDAGDTLAASHAVASDTAVYVTLESVEKEGFRRPGVGIAVLDSGYTPTTSHIVGSNAKAVLNLEADEKEKCSGPSESNAVLGGGDASLELCALSSDIAVTSILASKQTEEHHDPDNTGTSSSLESKEVEECPEPDHGDAPTTLYIVGSEASSNLESKETEVCHGHVDEYAENVAADAPTVVGSGTALRSSLDSKETEELCGHNDGRAELDVGNAPTASITVGSDGEPVLTLNIKGNEDRQGSGEGIAKQDAVDAPPACTIGFDNRTASTFDPKDGRPEDANAELDAGAALIGADIPTASIMVPKDKEECHVPDDVDAAKNAGATPRASCVAHTELDAGAVFRSTDIPTASTMVSKDQEECHGPDDGDAAQNAGGTPIASCIVHTEIDAGAIFKGADIPTASVMVPKDQEECHGPKDGNAAENADGTSTGSSVVHTELDAGAVFKGADSPTASIMVSNNQEECHGTDDGDAAQNADGTPRASCVVHTDTAAASTLE